jgi:hypothetical protein
LSFLLISILQKLKQIGIIEQAADSSAVSFFFIQLPCRFAIAIKTLEPIHNFKWIALNRFSIF